MTETIIKCGNLEIRPDTELARHYCKFIKPEHVKQMGGSRWYIDVSDNFTIELTICTHDLSDRNDLMNLWKKAGYIKETSPTHIAISTYHTEPDGRCFGRYNITHNPHSKLNFDWLLPYTPGNAAQLIAECIRMYEMDIRTTAEHRIFAPPAEIA